MRSVDLIREIEALGWVLNRIRGSHHIFKHPSLKGRVVVPHPKQDLGVGVVGSIRKGAKGLDDALSRTDRTED
jgi:predicted RNA binding protein YcfA (HicA-like mRNA interferase family)